jgi:hypothetical protein
MTRNTRIMTTPTSTRTKELKRNLHKDEASRYTLPRLESHEIKIAYEYTVEIIRIAPFTNRSILMSVT